MKQSRENEQVDSQLYRSAVTSFNAKVFRKLQNAFNANFDVDLLFIFSTKYSARLRRKKKQKVDECARLIFLRNWQVLEVDVVTSVNIMSASTEQDLIINHHTNELTSSIDIATIVFSLSESVQTLLETHAHNISNEQSQSLSINLSNIIKISEIIWQFKACCDHAIVKCSANIVAKIVLSFENYTEYISMQYLVQHASDISTSKSLSLMSSNRTSYIFMFFVLNLTVNQIWLQLSRDQKVSISDQLNDALLRLRALNVPDSVSLSDVDDEECKDIRRHIRICQEFVRTCAAFEDFKFFNSHFESFAYIFLLRDLSSSHTAKVVFSHEDLRPENIVIQPDQHGNYFLIEILDWEKSEFYSDYFECIKTTSNMSLSDANDWYLYLSRYVSSATYSLMWLVNRVWDIHIAWDKYFMNRIVIRFYLLISRKHAKLRFDRVQGTEERYESSKNLKKKYLWERKRREDW